MYSIYTVHCISIIDSIFLQVNIQAVTKDANQKVQIKEEELDDLRRKLTSYIRELESQIEEEKKQRSSAVSARKKMESEISELEAQLESESKGRDDAVKQYRKIQAQFKDSQLDAEDARKSLDGLSGHVKDLEKKVRSLEGDLSHTQEVSTCNRERGV